MGEKKEKKKKDKKDGKKDGKKKKDHGEKKEKKHHEMVMNARGEMVPAAQFAVEQSLEFTTKSLVAYKERMTGLITTNEVLQENCTQQEKDALDVIAALHAESDRKESQIKAIRDEMEAAMERAKLERQAIIDEAERKIQEMNSILNEKDAAFKVMQAEFAVIKDFRKKRQDMLKELEYQKDELADTQRQHKETVTRMERKFFEEKIRLQKEANRKISELASKAHKEAVLNLNETTKEIYKENIRMAESLRYHVQEGEELSKQNRALLQANRQLMEEKDLHNVIVKEKVLQVKQQAQEIKDLNTKIESMEHSLSHVVREFEHEREIIGKLARRELNEVRKVAARLRENLEVKSYEMKHIKRLAQHVLDQRTKLERFFMDSFDHVRCQIVKEREQAKKAAHNDYNKKIREVMSKKAQFPPVQSFRANATPLTNNQFNLSTATAVATSLMKPPLSPPTQTAIAAEDPSITSTTTQHQYQTAAPAAAVHAAGNASQVDIHDLSWADKERVLRLLFAKMNGIALGVDDDDGDEDGAGAAAEEEDPSIQDYQNDFYDDSMYHDGNGHGGGAGPVPPSEFNNVVEFSPQQQGQTQEGSSQQREPTLPRGTQPQQEPTKQNDLIITELAAGGDAQNSDIPLQDDHTQSENGDNNGGGGNRDEGEPGFLTTAYSGSRRNLLPKSDNSLPPIISAGITPRTETSRAASITSNK